MGFSGRAVAAQGEAQHAEAAEQQRPGGRLGHDRDRHVVGHQAAVRVGQVVDQEAVARRVRVDACRGVGEGAADQGRVARVVHDHEGLAHGEGEAVDGRGVKINYNYYWTDEFRNPDIENTRVPVRYDPFDGGTAWAYVGKRWLKCDACHWQAFNGRSQKEIMLATAELRKQRRRHSGRAVISARTLADFLTTVEAKEILLPQRAKDAALHEVLAVIDGHRAAMPAPSRQQPSPTSHAPEDVIVVEDSPWSSVTNPENLQDFESF